MNHWKLQDFEPKLFSCLRSGYSLFHFKNDLIAGITVGMIALPLGMAFAISSGVSPEKGLFTAIIAGFLISFFGGSRYQIGGPTGAFVVLLFSILQRSGEEGLALATLFASFFLVLMGLFRLGDWIRHVPHALIVGFTSAIALLIFSSQIKDFFGFSLPSFPVSFLGKWTIYLTHLKTLDVPTFLLGSFTLAWILAVRKFFPKIPWGISAILMAASLAYFLKLPVETIHSKFGPLPNRLPLPSLPSFSPLFTHGKEIWIDALSIAFLAAVESLLSAVIADRMGETKHRSNCELIAQGIGNFGSVLFGGIAATGAIARTIANIKNGAKTPLSGIVHALTLLFLMVFFSPWVSQIPLAALSAILMIVAWNMAEFKPFLLLLKGNGKDRAILLCGFFLTLFFDITLAICAGMLLFGMFQLERLVSKPKP